MCLSLNSKNRKSKPSPFQMSTFISKVYLTKKKRNHIVVTSTQGEEAQTFIFD